MSGTKAPALVSSLPSARISSVTQINGLVMPSGMIMTSDMSQEAMEDMSAVVSHKNRLYCSSLSTGRSNPHTQDRERRESVQP